MPVMITCHECPTIFPVKPSYAHKAKFCSLPCKYRAMQRPPIHKTCPQCGQTFVLRGMQRYSEGPWFCSIPCGAIFTGKEKRGRSIQTFWQRVQRCTHEEWCIYCCWPWVGKLSTQGYGKITLNKKQCSAHRIAWQLFHGYAMPDDMKCAHYCHLTTCCNPSHLHMGTQQDNIDDSVRDHRHTFGERNSQATLTETTALVALAYRVQGLSYQKIADRLNVGHAAIEKVCVGITWKHLRIPPPAVLKRLIEEFELQHSPSLFKYQQV